MSIESTFRELFSESASFYPESTVDKYGKRSFSASPVVAPAHLVTETQLSRTADGREVVETGRLYLYGDVDVTVDHKCRLQNGAEPIVIAVDTPHDQNGVHHTVVRLGGKTS
jgi:hypothetical protein